MKKIYSFLCFLFLTISFIISQSRPFPQNVTYPFGYKATNITLNAIKGAYTRWKNSFLFECNGMYRVSGDDTSRTISEGMGYGMLLTAYFGEKEYFDGLLEFYKSKRTPEALNLMAWSVSCNDFSDPKSATDGDLDVAFSLIIAYCQWGGYYLEEAENILSIIKADYFVTCEDIYILKPGPDWGGCSLTDISYYSPAYFRVFSDFTGDTFWDTVATHAYLPLLNSANSVTGLVPDWQSYDGQPGGNPPSGRVNYYRYDASRTPWRMALDYIWNGNNTAQYWCEKITDWANAQGAANIIDGYDLNGNVRGTYHNSAFVGGFAVGSMCKSESVVSSFAGELVNLHNSGYDDMYFNLSLRCIYMLVLTGNFWKPGILNSTFVNKKEKDIVVYPNPILNKTNINIRSLNEIKSAQIVSYSGQTILNKDKINSRNFTLDTSKLNRGIYFITMTSGNGLGQNLKIVMY